jgi:hypothetical protein
MKKVLFILLAAWIFISCTKEFDLDKFPQEWQLTTMYGQIPNSTTYGSDMEWQESYQLNSDRTFTKTRVRDGVLTEASGTFEFKDLTDGKFLELTYTSNSPIIGSCTVELKETFWVKSDKKMSGTWSNCDGPGLEYERIK